MKDNTSKVVIVGAGAVGSASAFSLLNKGSAGEIVLIDRNKKKAEGEAMDLQHSLEFQTRNTAIKAGDWEDCGDADIVVLTAAAPYDGVPDRNAMLRKTEAVLSGIVPEIMKSGFDGIFIVVSNPVDVMTWLVRELSGLPASRVIGTGTGLETARLKQLIGQLTGMDPRSIDAVVMGEHGNSMMVPWSHVRAGGKPLSDCFADDSERYGHVDLDKLLEDTREAGTRVLNAKGNTQYAIAACVTSLVTAILNNDNTVIPVSAMLEGQYGQDGVYCGVPVILDRHGVRDIGTLHLTDEEQEKFAQSARTVKENIGKLDAAKE